MALLRTAPAVGLELLVVAWPLLSGFGASGTRCKLNMSVTYHFYQDAVNIYEVVAAVAHRAPAHSEPNHLYLQRWIRGFSRLVWESCTKEATDGVPVHASGETRTVRTPTANTPIGHRASPSSAARDGRVAGLHTIPSPHAKSAADSAAPAARRCVGLEAGGSEGELRDVSYSLFLVGSGDGAVLLHRAPNRVAGVYANASAEGGGGEGFLTRGCVFVAS
ncbi:hypothetical protein BJ912DRAFT_924064 [Pholiota molesta]|nr:hypothetical protein BJ912DRAFT_924064 [Pholiota molesta]